jgi:spore coat polysaccharide biosynthesis protein SpsF
MVVFSIQARMGSTRLPGKVLLPLGDQRMLDHVVSRCNESNMSGEVIVTTGDSPPNDAIREWCQRLSLRCVSGPEEDLVERHCRVLSQTDSNTLVRITGDCPFVPPEEINRVIEAHRKNDDFVFTTNNSDLMPVGTAVDVFDREIIKKLSNTEETHPVTPLRKADSPWNIQVTDSERWTEFGTVHTAVDTPADYWKLIDAVATVGTDPYRVTSHIADSNN